MPSRFRTAAATALALAMLCSSAAADDGATREWNQFRGSAARDGFVEMESVKSVPEIIWKHTLPGPVVGEPVTWSG